MKYVVSLCLVGFAFFVLFQIVPIRYQLSTDRYFDADEFAHLHWAADMLKGYRPYVDFLFFFPPLYHVVLMPILSHGWGTITPVLEARFVSFVILLLVAFASSIVFYVLRRDWGVAVISGLVVLLLPIPIDRLMEIRPDPLGTVFLLLAVLFQIRHTQSKKFIWEVLLWFFYACTILTIPKYIPNVFLGLCMYILGFMQNHDRKTIKTAIRAWSLGFGIPMAIFFLWLLLLGNFGKALYSLTRLPLEANRLSEKFGMRPDLFFNPNDIIYGCSGWCDAIIVNHILWIVGILVALFRLFTPFLTKNSTARNEVLIYGNLFVQLLLFMTYVPLKHPQYLIPVVPFIGIALADFWFIIREKLTRFRLGSVVFVILFMIVGYMTVNPLIASAQAKTGWNNNAEKASIQKIFATVPMNTYLFDLDGRSLYFRNPYPACCIPFGQFSMYLSQKLPPVSDFLEQNKTPFIYQGELLKTRTLPYEDQKYIEEHYQAYNGDETLLYRK